MKLGSRTHLTLEEVCAATGYGYETVFARVTAGKIPSEKGEGEQLLVAKAEVQKMLARSIDPLYTIFEASAFLSLGYNSVFKEVTDGAKGWFPNAFKLGGESGHWRIPERDLAQLMRFEREEEPLSLRKFRALTDADAPEPAPEPAAA